MMNVRRLLSSFALIVLGIFFFCASPVHAQEDVAITIARGLAHIELGFKPEKDATVDGQRYLIGTPGMSQATGFLVSEDGYLLTSYHLLAPVVATDGTNVTLTIHMNQSDGEAYSAAIVDTRKQLDLALLKIRPKFEVKLWPLRLGRADDLVGTEVYTSGFAGSQAKHKSRVNIVDRNGPIGTGYMWAVQEKFASGQSGSPVYKADGEVIGIVKGEDTQADVGYMVPIDFADSLISHLRMRSMELEVTGLREQVTWLNNQIAKGPKPIGPRLTTVEDDLKGVNTSLTDFSKRLSWSVKNNKVSEGNHTVTISYEKPFADKGPKINRLEIVATPIYYRRDTPNEVAADQEPLIDKVFFDTELQDHGGKVELKRADFNLDAFFALRKKVDVIVKMKLKIKPYSDDSDWPNVDFEPLTVDFTRSITN